MKKRSFLPPLRHISNGTRLLKYSFKGHNMAGAGAGAGAKIRDYGGTGAKNK